MLICMVERRTTVVTNTSNVDKLNDMYIMYISSIAIQFVKTIRMDIYCFSEAICKAVDLKSVEHCIYNL